MTAPDSRSIHTLAKSVWNRPGLKHRLNAELRAAAEAFGSLPEAMPFARKKEIEASRLHADFTRMLRGDSCGFVENTPALANIEEVLGQVEFTSDGGSLTVASASLKVNGEMDASGFIKGWIPCILELKVVDFIPQFVRAADACQLLLYAFAKNHGRVDAAALGVVYVQPYAPFRTELRSIFNPERALPFVRELTAA